MVAPVVDRAGRRLGAGDVEPTAERLDGQDPVAYILSSNIQRRHLSKGQAAMATVRARDFSKITPMRELAHVASASRSMGRQLTDHAQVGNYASRTGKASSY